MYYSTGRLLSALTALLALPAPALAAQAGDASAEFYFLALGLAAIGITGLILIRRQSSQL